MRGRAVRVARGVLAAALVALLAAACDEENPYAPEIIEEITFDASLGVDLAQYMELPEGVWIRDLVVGTGAVIASGDSISIDHTAWLRTGAQFSAGVFPTRHDAGRLIPGFDLGLAGMALGGMRRIIVPPELGYGEAGRDPVPPGAVMLFEVELLAILP